MGFSMQVEGARSPPNGTGIFNVREMEFVHTREFATGMAAMGRLTFDHGLNHG